MKELLSVLAVFSCTYSAAQVKIITAVDTSLYVGVDNPVKIESATIPLSKLKLRSGNGEVSGKEGKYIIKCSKAGQPALLDVVYNNKVVATKKINVNRINDPIAYALGERLFTDTFITKKELVSIKSLIVKLNYPLAKYAVVECSAEIIHHGKSRGALQNSGRDLSPEIKAFLKYAEAGDEVLFNSIRVLCPDARKKYVPPIRLKII